jgi:hypothetical protein
MSAATEGHSTEWLIIFQLNPHEWRAGTDEWTQRANDWLEAHLFIEKLNLEDSGDLDL